MTKEEIMGKFLALATKCENKHDTMSLTLDLLEEYSDDFESRTCKNCMCFQENTNRYGEYEGTCHNDIQEERDLGTVRKDFGCNKFERKDK